jgi:hypothetical protein
MVTAAAMDRATLRTDASADFVGLSMLDRAAHEGGQIPPSSSYVEADRTNTANESTLDGAVSLSLKQRLTDLFGRQRLEQVGDLSL